MDWIHTVITPRHAVESARDGDSVYMQMQPADDLVGCGLLEERASSVTQSMHAVSSIGQEGDVSSQRGVISRLCSAERLGSAMHIYLFLLDHASLFGAQSVPRYIVIVFFEIVLSCLCRTFLAS